MEEKIIEELREEYLRVEGVGLSWQAKDKLKVMSRTVVEWFEEEEVDVMSLGIEEALRFQVWASSRVKKDGNVCSAGTVQNYLKGARRFVDYLVKSGRRKDNPFRDLKYPRVGMHISRNVLSEAQMGKLLDELGKFDQLEKPGDRIRRYRVHVASEFLYASGLRVEEAARVKEADLDLEHRVVYVREGKGGEGRTGFLSGYACEVMREYLKLREGIKKDCQRVDEEWLFGVHKSSLASLINEELKEVCKKLELPVITSHGFRHSLGTHLLRAGCDMRYIQVILGHKALATTQIYTLVDKDDLKRSLDEYHPRQWNGRGKTDNREIDGRRADSGKV